MTRAKIKDNVFAEEQKLNYKPENSIEPPITSMIGEFALCYFVTEEIFLTGNTVNS